MKILVIGGTGTIGKTIVSHYQQQHQVITAGFSRGDYQVDIKDTQSIADLYQQTGQLDAIICAAGEAKWDLFKNLSEDDFHIGLNSKLMGQVNVVRLGLDYLNDQGSITLTTGILADDPVIKTSSAAMVNGAIHSFVKAASLEITNGKRLNVVSSGVVMDAYEKYQSYFPGHPPIPMDRVVLGYVRSVEGRDHGSIIKIYN
ncbi:short chain dehydrogenase [Marinicella sp. W31]|uniref:short chain dehydrogenase n=1 Tax=Marinicella sp. W31 TaxID=3023713 RepID=UPI0037569BED